MSRDVELNIDVITTGEEGFAEVDEGAKRAASGVDALGDAARGTQRDLARLDRAMIEARATAAALGTEFVRTGDTDALKSFKDARTSLNNLRSVQQQVRAYSKDLDQLASKKFSLPTPTPNNDFANLASALPLGIGKIPPQVLLPSAAALAAFLGAAVNGAVQAVGATGLVGVGIAGALQDARVKSAVADLGHSLKAEFIEATSSFDQPVIDAANRAKVELGALGPELHGVFAAVAPDVARLEEGAVGFVRELLPGLQRLASASAPSFRVFADELPQLGAAATNFFDGLNANALASRGAVDGLRVTFALLNGTIGALGSGLGDLAALFEVVGGGALGAAAKNGILQEAFHSLTNEVLFGFIPGLAQAKDLYDHWQDKQPKSQFTLLNQGLADTAAKLQQVSSVAAAAGLGVSLASQDFGLLSQRIAQTAQTSDALAGAITDHLLNTTLGMDQANLQFAQSLTSVSQALKDNHGQLDIHTAKGQADRSAVLESVAANIRQYDSLIAAGIGADDASKAYDANTQQLYKALHAAGLNDQAIDGMIGKYKGVPANVATDVELHGVAQAISNLNDTLRAINGLPPVRTVSIIVRTIYQSFGAEAPGLAGLTRTSALLHHQGAKGGVFPEALGGVTSYASGGGYSRSGILRPSNPGTILAGEPQTGGEVFVPRLGIAAARGLALANVAAGWHGGHVVPNWSDSASRGSTVLELRPNGTQLGDLLVELLRQSIRVRGGNVQTVVGSSS